MERAVLVLIFGTCFRYIRQILSVRKDGMHKFTALVSQPNHSGIRQLLAATKVSVRQSTALVALVCQGKH